MATRRRPRAASQPGWRARASGCGRREKRPTRCKTSSSSSPRRASSPPDGWPMRRIIAQARKELTQLRRDRLALGLALVLPVGLTALMGTSVSLTVTDIPIVIQDLDQTPLSRRYADAFRASLTYRVLTLPPATSPERMLAAGRARAASIVLYHFERPIRLAP